MSKRICGFISSAPLQISIEAKIRKSSLQLVVTVPEMSSHGLRIDSQVEWIEIAFPRVH